AAPGAGLGFARRSLRGRPPGRGALRGRTLRRCRPPALIGARRLAASRGRRRRSGGPPRDRDPTSRPIACLRRLGALGGLFGAFGGLRFLFGLLLLGEVALRLLLGFEVRFVPPASLQAE